MNYIIIPNATDADHLNSVTEQMRKLGAPSIHACWSEVYGSWVALEGSHRITAAKALGHTPNLILVEDLEAQIVDFDPDNDSGDSVGKHADEAYRNPIISFEDININGELLS